MAIIHAKKTWLITVSVVALAALGFLALNSNGLVNGVESRLLENSRLSEQGLQAVIDATKSKQEGQLKTFLENNPSLAAYLNTEVQALQLQNEWHQIEVNYFSRVSSSLRHLLQGAERSRIKQALNESAGGEQRLINYLGAFISLQKKLGNGYVSSLSDAGQQAVADAVKLLANLNDNRNLRQELIEIASWYATEKGGRPSSKTYQEWLLQYAWELSLVDLKLHSGSLSEGIDEDIGEDIQVSLKRETDLTRLLNHPSDVVVKNAANLISVFVPENAITALRFQLVRSNNNQERFLLLDAIKSYGEQRSQIEPQLKNMLRLTHDTDLQEKIMETINHLHGRPNKLRLPS